MMVEILQTEYFEKASELKEYYERADKVEITVDTTWPNGPKGNAVYTLYSAIGEAAQTNEQVQQACKDWLSNRAYIDGNGNYHVKREGHTNGPIAKWNKAVKREFNSVTHFHFYAKYQVKKGLVVV